MPKLFPPSRLFGALLLLPVLLATFGVACAGPAPTAAPTKVASASVVHGLDVAAMDRSVAPGSDFFLYANGGWLKTADIPADRPSTGVWLRLQEVVEKRKKDILDEAAHAPSGSELRKIGDYYAAFLDEGAVETRGIEPLKGTLEEIASLGDAHALSAFLGGQLRADVDAMNNTHFQTSRVLGLWVEQDLNDPSRYAPYLLQGGLGMPDRSYYLDESAPMAALRTKYVAHLATVLRLAGIADADAKAARVFAFEKRIAESHAKREDSEDIGKANNPWSRSDFVARAAGMDWDAFFGAAGLGSQASFIVWHPRAVTALGAFVKGETLQTWKEYLTARAIDRAARFLPKAFVDEDFAFYGRELEGLQAPVPRWRRGLEATDAALGEAVGKVYVDRFFPSESKKAVEAIVANLIAAFSRRIDNLAWMAAGTKAKAKEKLETLRVGIGYPDKWRDYGDLRVERGDAFGNDQRAQTFEYRRNVAKLGRPVDRGEWAMVPQVIDAVNMPVRNALNFPAAILVPPFFDPQASSAANYGAIGAVVGHEISHSFDDQGARFDAHGKYASWWTPDDLARFQASGAALAAQFSTYKPLPDVAINGKQTLSENIADLAGLAVAYDAWRASLGGAESPVAEGLTGDQQFFVAYGHTWQSKERDETLRQQLLTDGHAPAHYRALTVRNLDAWYAAFGVKEGDALYLKPADRVRIW
ncbi:MAG: M13 family metallopeptidase [Polyangiaceae bacterium]